MHVACGGDCPVAAVRDHVRTIVSTSGYAQVCGRYRDDVGRVLVAVPVVAALGGLSSGGYLAVRKCAGAAAGNLLSPNSPRLDFSPRVHGLSHRQGHEPSAIVRFAGHDFRALV